MVVGFLDCPFGNNSLRDDGRVQLSGWVVDGVTWAEGSVRVNAKWCKNSIELSGFSGVGGSLAGGDRLIYVFNGGKCRKLE